MDRQIATVAEDNGVRILTITVVANRAFGVLFFSSSNGFAIDSG